MSGLKGGSGEQEGLTLNGKLLSDRRKCRKMTG